jgi:hypothetical protein
MAEFVDWSGGVVEHAVRIDSSRSDSASEVLRRALRRLPLAHPAQGTGSLRGEAAWEAAAGFHNALLETTMRLVNDLSSGEWLWYLRRWGDPFEINALSTTGPYCQRLAETITGRSRARGPALPRSESVLLDLGDTRIRKICRLRDAVILLYETHSLLRWAGKNSEITFRVRSRPAWTPSQELKDSVALYDARWSEGGGSPLAGAALHEPVRLTDKANLRTSIPITFRLPKTASIPLPPENVKGFTSVYGQYIFALFDLARIPHLMDESLSIDERWPNGLAEVIALLMTCLDESFLLDGIINFTSRGYRVTRYPDLQSQLQASVDFLSSGGHPLIPSRVVPTDAARVTQYLLSYQGSTWPPRPGAPLRRLDSQDRLCVDLLSAGELLFDLIRRPPLQGADAVTWSTYMEQHTQKMIDASAISSPPDVRALRGRTLRRRGNAITDVDAVAVAGPDLLLISCKGRAMTDAYERGEYGDVLNVQALVKAAEVDLRRVITDLNLDRTGDNFDFSRFRRVMGVVVLPFVPFLPIGRLTEEIAPGLRCVVAVSELEQWARSL